MSSNFKNNINAKKKINFLFVYVSLKKDLVFLNENNKNKVSVMSHYLFILNLD